MINEQLQLGENIRNSGTQAPTIHLSTYRRAILDLIVGSSLFTAEEQLVASHNVHECEDAQRLVTWLRNVRRETDYRETAQEQPAPAVELVTANERAIPMASIRATATAALHLLPAHAAVPVKPRSMPPTISPRPKVGYSGRAADHMANVHDHHLEQWYIQETGLSFADRLAL